MTHTYIYITSLLISAASNLYTYRAGITKEIKQNYSKWVFGLLIALMVVIPIVPILNSAFSLLVIVSTIKNIFKPTA